MPLDDAVDFLKSCDGRTAVVCHGDADGCCSSAITCIVLEHLHGELPETFSPLKGGSRLTQDLVDELQSFEYIVVLDLGEKNKELIAQIDDKSVLWLDHHKDAEPVEGDIVYVNPYDWLSEDDVPPTSFLAYEIANMIFDAEDLCWLSAVGVVGDKEEEACSSVIDKTFELYPHLEAGSRGRLEILKYMVGWISSGRSHSGGEGADVATQALIRAGLEGNPALLFEGSEHADKLRFFEEEISGEIRRVFEESKIKVGDGVVFCRIDKRTFIQNYLAGILRGKYPRKVIIVANFGIHDDVVQIELRRTSEINVNLRELARASVKGLKASAGGHPEAAGIRIPKSDWKDFKKTIFELANEKVNSVS